MNALAVHALSILSLRTGGSLAKIYTRRGDDGSTGLFGGPRVSKDDLRVSVYGDVDELNSALGVAREELTGDLRALADSLQTELFTLGAELATPEIDKAPKSVPRIAAADVTRLEQEIDRLTGELPPQTHFLLPAGSRPGALLHLARTVCRRAERNAVQLARSEAVSANALAYLNRLSDLLFTMARAANVRSGAPEVPWIAPAPK
jgi:cob(I)alamin adenosyltransferase